MSKQRLTPLGSLVTLVVVLGLLAAGAWLLVRRPLAGAVTGEPALPPRASGGEAGASRPEGDADLPGLVETLTTIPRLAPAQPYPVKDRTIDLELSEYAGYAGLIVANGGLEPSESSVFFRKHGFKVRIRLSEEESWSALNGGALAASATTADVLAVYGRQFQVVVPAQIGYSRGADGVVVRGDVRRVNDLRGKVLVAAQFTEADFFLRFLAQEAGIGVNALPDLAAAPDPQRINLVYAEDAFVAGDVFLRAALAASTRLVGAVTWAPKTTEVVKQSQGKAHLLVSNRNLLIVADVLVVNRGFAEREPALVAGLVDGLLEGNRQVRASPEAHLEVIARAFGWKPEQALVELAKVHLANLPENLAFFAGTIDAAGSFGGIYQSAVLAYGDFLKDPVDGERFLDLVHLKALEESGAYASEKVAIAPIRSGGAAPPLEGDPLLSKDIRFLFQPNSAVLDLESQDNLASLAAIRRLLQVSPGSMLLLRGHVDGAQIDQFRRSGGEAFVRKMALEAMQLSRDRAAEVQRLLIERHGADRSRLEIVGRGWEEPAGTVMEANRRVEVQWFTVE